MAQLRIDENFSHSKLFLGPFLYWILYILRLILDAIINLTFETYYRILSPLSKQPRIPPPTDILFLSATDLASKIRSGQLTSLEVVDACVDHIKDVNPLINAIVADRFEEARKEAREVDRILKDGDAGEVGFGKYSVENMPLLGVPFTVKENIMLKGMPNTAGVVARKGTIAKETAEAVKRVREAGGIPLGVTNTTELCMWWEPHNKVYGTTNNPYDYTRSAGGSSSGEGAIVGAAGVPFGIGTDIAGSIRIPACNNGVFGHKPSVGTTPVAGEFPEPEGDIMDIQSIGPICRYAKDLAPLMKIMAGDKAFQLDLDSPVNLSSLRIHYAFDGVGNPLTVPPLQLSIRSALISAVEHLSQRCGAEVIPPQVHAEKLRPIKEALHIFAASTIHNPVHSFRRDLTNGKEELNGWMELVKWMLMTSQYTLPAIKVAVEEQMGLPAEKKAELLASREKLKVVFDDMLGNNGIFLFPTTPTAPNYHSLSLSTPEQLGMTAFCNVLGLPATHVPMGLDPQGLPIGISVIANVGQDRLCFAVARELEAAFGGWKCP